MFDLILSKWQRVYVCGYDLLCSAVDGEDQRTQHQDVYIFYLWISVRHDHDPVPVPCQALWLVIYKYGIPPVLVQLIQSLHGGLKTNYRFTVDGLFRTVPAVYDKAVPLLHPFSTSTSMST